MASGKSVYQRILQENPIAEDETVRQYAERIYQDKEKYGIEANSLKALLGSIRNYIPTDRMVKVKRAETLINGVLTSEKFGFVKDIEEIDKEGYTATKMTTNPYGTEWVRWVKNENELSIDEWESELEKRKRPFKIEKQKGSGASIYLLSDFHMGAYVGKIIKTPEFSFNVIESYLKEIAETINSFNEKEVYIGLLGDFIESFTGLNHRNSWKGLSKNAYGIKAVKLAHNLLRDNLYSKVKNLKWVGFISGNHDRVTEGHEGDEQGEVGEMMQYLFELECKDIKSEWHPIIISKEVDGINYLLTHGHLGISKTEVSQVVYQYGKQGVYNVFAKGHKHSRETKKTFSKKKIMFEKFDVVSYDTADYRAITVPPLFTGNFYSESNGWNSSAGFVRMKNNGRGKLFFADYTI